MHWYYGQNLHSIRTFATAPKGALPDFVGAKGRPNDLISDSITQIKNGYSRRFDKVYLSYSKEILQLLEALLQGGYIQNYAFNGVPQQPLNTRSDRRTKDLDKHIGGIEVSLKYYQSLPAIKGIQRLSKPNKRLYFSKKKIIQVSQEQS